MAALNLENLDDPPMQDQSPSFVGGQMSFGPPDQLQLNQAAELLNIDIKDSTATTRRGAESIGMDSDATGVLQGLFYFDTPTLELLVAVVGGTQYVFDGSAWDEADDAWTMGTTTGQVCVAQLVNELYFVDGVSNLFSWDGTNNADLGSTTGTAGDLPAGASIIISATGRLWATGFASAPDTLWASFYLEGDKWDADYGNIQVGQGEGDPITGLCEIDNSRLAIFKRNSIYILTAAPQTITTVDANGSLANASLTKISDTIGCVSHRSIARVGKDIFFLSDGGVYSIGRVLAQTDRELNDVPLSLPVQDVIDRINWEAAGTAAGTFWGNRYLLSLPLDGETEPSYVLVFNTLRQAWSGLWTGWNANTWAVSKFGGSERLNFGRADAVVWTWLDYVEAANAVESSWQDDGSDFESRVVTRAMIFGEPKNEKSPFNVETEFYGSEAAASLSLRLDEQDAVSVQDAYATNPGELLLPFTLPATLPSRGIKRRSFGAQHLTPFRSMQAVVQANGGKMALRAVIATAFLNTFKVDE